MKKSKNNKYKKKAIVASLAVQLGALRDRVEELEKALSLIKKKPESMRRSVSQLKDAQEVLAADLEEVRATRAPNRPMGCCPSGCGCHRCMREKEQSKDPAKFLAVNKEIKPPIEIPITDRQGRPPVKTHTVKSTWKGYPGLNFGGI